MADGTEGSDIFIQSRMPADNGYGQNGFQGPSSDLPGQRTTSGFLPENECKLAPDYRKDHDWQTRVVKADAYATHPGMKAQAAPALIPAKNLRPVTRKA